MSGWKVGRLARWQAEKWELAALVAILLVAAFLRLHQLAAGVMAVTVWPIFFARLVSLAAQTP